MLNASEPAQTNWKNVNNWHWVEKNWQVKPPSTETGNVLLIPFTNNTSIPWAKDYVPSVLNGLTKEVDNVVLSTGQVSGFSGDADINQRKGKLITVYDIAFNVAWEAKFDTDKTVSGRINIPEFMHDTDADELVAEVTTEVTSAEAQTMRSLVIKHLVPLLKEKLANFSKDMIAANGKDVHITKDDMKGHPSGTQYKPKPPAADDAEVAKKPNVPSSVVGALSTITMNVEFVCSASDLYNTLLEPGRAQIWSRGPAQIKPEVGAEVSLFGGNVTGKILELVPNKKIVQTWRLKSWPSNHHSKVTITLEEQRESVTLRLTQTEVPVGEKDLTQKNWTGYYFNGIKGAFGFGAVGF
ncbi:hypothetical protein HDU81_004465 [Chytriomyces hyalinus]|nr:hypothetical protein HDU81_004465 [Chytriomyces hyalinus]